jgi:hypothetical protein
MSRTEFFQLDFAHALAPLALAALPEEDPELDVAQVAYRNFRLSGTRDLAVTWRGRATDNLAAIRLLQKIEAEGRPATSREQAELIKFCTFSSSELSQNCLPPPR